MDNGERFNIHKVELVKQNMLLPLGTILSIVEKEDKKIIIVGHNKVSQDNLNYDYIGQLLPDDSSKGSDLILFNSDHIIKIHSIPQSINKDSNEKHLK